MKRWIRVGLLAVAVAGCGSTSPSTPASRVSAACSDSNFTTTESEALIVEFEQIERLGVSRVETFMFFTDEYEKDFGSSGLPEAIICIDAILEEVYE